MWTSAYWLAAGERAVKTLAQTLAAALAASGIGIIHAGLLQALTTAGLAAVLSLLTSAASTDLGTTGSPSLVADPSTARAVAAAKAAATRAAKTRGTP